MRIIYSRMVSQIRSWWVVYHLIKRKVHGIAQHRHTHGKSPNKPRLKNRPQLQNRKKQLILSMLTMIIIIPRSALTKFLLIHIELSLLVLHFEHTRWKYRLEISGSLGNTLHLILCVLLGTNKIVLTISIDLIT